MQGVAFPDFLRRPPAQRLLYYVGAPLALAVFYGMLRSGLAALMPLPQALLFWSLLMVPTWWAASACAGVAHAVLRPWRPPLWFICVVGSVSQALILSPAYRAFYRWAQDNLATIGEYHGYWPLPAFTLEYVSVLAATVAPGAVVFFAVNLFCDRVLDMPRYRYDDDGSTARRSPHAASEAAASESGAVAIPVPPIEPAQASADAGAQIRPALLRQSRLPETASIYALTAEEHYVRIFSDAGTDLVRYRFSDALDELAAQKSGMQVHRSWWVRLDQATHWHLRGRLFELEFERGLRVPVSLAFREAALMHAPADVRVRARRGARRSAGQSAD